MIKTLAATCVALLRFLFHRYPSHILHGKSSGWAVLNRNNIRKARPKTNNNNNNNNNNNSNNNSNKQTEPILLI